MMNFIQPMRSLCLHCNCSNRGERQTDEKRRLFSYVGAEFEVIRRSGGKTLGYFLPTDFAGPTSEAYGRIEFSSLADYERYRGRLCKFFLAPFARIT